MEKLLIFVIFCLTYCGVTAQDLQVVNLRTDYLVNPIGIENRRPGFTWEILSLERGTKQTAYEIRAAYSEKDLYSTNKRIWHTGKILSEQSIWIKYSGPKLKSRDIIYWQVRVWDQNDKVSKWSKVSFFEMGLLAPEEWSATWVEPDILESDVSISTPAQYLRKKFEVKDKVKRARLYITARGVYKASFNGCKVGDQLFTPGWTSYSKRLQYQVYDVTKQLQYGENVLGILLGDGWFRGHLKWGNQKNLYGNKLAVLAQLEIQYENGICEMVVTDQSWKSSTGPICLSDFYDGETYDARLEMPGWDSIDFDPSKWRGVQIRNFSKNVLVASESIPVRIIEEIKPIAMIITPKGERVFDFGQNFVGFTSIKLSGQRGSKLRLSFAEVLDLDGNFYTANLKAARASDEYIFKGEGIETFEPTFTFHGFRYMRVDEYNGDIGLNNIIGKVIHSDMNITGKFVCSDPLVNKLQRNIMWSLKGNFVDIPTDCPQRNERLGWTGDVLIFASTACFNVDAAAFFSKWLKDLRADQLSNGSIPHVIPEVDTGDGSAGWSDVAVVLPWILYKVYGNIELLSRQYEAMKRWVDFCEVRSAGTYIISSGFHYGDWLAYSVNDPDYTGATTDKDLIATAYFAHSATLLSKIATILKKKDDAKRYRKISDKVKEAFKHEFMTSTGRLSSNTQTAYVLALAFDLMPEEQRQRGIERLAADVRKFGHITTGFLGTPLINDVLTDTGYNNLAYLLLLRKEYPSWLYPITKGATTMWERWDGIKPDGTFQNWKMNSFNHYAYGAVGHWLYSRVAGLSQDDNSIGYKKIVIRPYIYDGLTSASAEYHSMYGQIISSWEVNDTILNMHIVIPPNTSGKIYFPVDDFYKIKERNRNLVVSQEIKYIGKESNWEVAEVGSGDYYFTLPNRRGNRK